MAYVRNTESEILVDPIISDEPRLSGSVAKV
jgi:hypothetical protein